MKIYTIALFGEAEKGDYYAPYSCKNLYQLSEYFGNPPQESKGLYYAIQALLFQRELIFLRIKEEGFSIQDYLYALKSLEGALKENINAFCLPGVGDFEILEAVTPLCKKYHSLLITTEADFYDYLTCDCA